MNNSSETKKKINVFFNEYNLLMGSGGVTYFPLVSGILSANAKKNYKINMFDKINKFKKYDSLDIKNNRKIYNS